MYYQLNENNEITAISEVQIDKDWIQTNREIVSTFDGRLVFKEETETEEYKKEALKEDLRYKRNINCFPIINRGALWYNKLTKEQQLELSDWYNKWLDAPETLEEPNTPEWLK